MLQYMRQRASSWMIKVLLSIIVLAFVFMGLGNFRESPDVPVASVNGEDIPASVFNDRYYDLREGFRQQLGGSLNEETLRMLNLRERALDQLISEKIIVQKATDYGLLVTDEELARSIRGIGAFQRQGRFDSALYNQLLQRNRIMPEVFEQRQRTQLLIEKMQSLITDGVKVSEDEARRWYDWYQTRIRIDFVRFDPETYQEITVPPEVLKKYFDEHRERYQMPARTKITFLAFVPEQYLDRVEVSDFEIESYYAENQARYRNEKTVEARHILFQVAGDEPDDLVEQRRREAERVYDKITRDGLDFSAAAREFSEGPSAGDGGRLGAFKRADMVAPFSEKAFSMTAGEVSQPVRTQFGWHLIKVDTVKEAATTPLSAVKDELRERLALNKARDLVYEEALRAFDTALDKDSVREAARLLGLSAETTSFFDREGPIREIPDSGPLARQASDLLKGDISDVVEVDGAYYLFQVDERLESRIPELEAVRERVTADVRKQLRDEKAASDAADFLLLLKQENRSLSEAAEQVGLRVETTGFFDRGEGDPETGHVPGLSETAFQLTPQKPLAESFFSGRGGYYVIALAERDIPAAAAFAAEKEQTLVTLRQRKKFQVFEQWLDAMKARSDISINERFL